MLAIIPARGGSKGLPGKNIKLLNGKPLIAYSIEAALNSKLVSRVIVSTDDKKIADIAKQFGAEIPFLRPVELATDTSSAIDNYIYTIDRLNTEESSKIDEFVILQPTSPLRTADDIDNAIKIFHDNQAESVISVYESPHPPEWSRKIKASGILTAYFEELTLKNRQDYNTAYLPNGAVTVLKFDLMRSKKTYYFDKTYPYIMTDENSVDIDTQLDFDLAKLIMERNYENE